MDLILTHKPILSIVPFLVFDIEINRETGLALITVKIQTILNFRKIIGKGEVEISVPSRGTLRDLLEIMVNTWGDELASRLFGPDSTTLLPYIRLMVNGRDIGFLKGMETVLQNGDEILILPPVAGG